MRPMNKIFLLMLAAVIGSGLLTAQSESKATGAFQQLRDLSGKWEGKDQDGTEVRTSFQAVAGNTAVLETLVHGGMDDMITLYSIDGDAIQLQHYCPTNNQPRMRATPAAGKASRLAFEFQGAGNLPDEAKGHQHKLVIEFQDATHMTERWTWRANGKDTEMIFHFRRMQG
jgi:hypothetical protein